MSESMFDPTVQALADLRRALSRVMMMPAAQAREFRAELAFAGQHLRNAETRIQPKTGVRPIQGRGNVWRPEPGQAARSGNTYVGHSCPD